MIHTRRNNGTNIFFDEYNRFASGSFITAYRTLEKNKAKTKPENLGTSKIF